MAYRNSLIVAALLAALTTSYAGTWLASPGKGSHASAGVTNNATFVDKVEVTSSGGGDTVVTIPGTLNVSAGNLVVAVFTGTVVASGATVGGEAMTQIVNITADGYSVSMWYKQNASANAAASVVGTYGSTVSFAVGYAANYSGVATSGALDVWSTNSAGNNATSSHATNRTAVNATTTNAADLFVFIEQDWDDKTTHTAQGTWTKRTAAGTKGWALCDKKVTTTGSYPNETVVVTNDTGDDRYYSIFATFKSN